MAWADVPDEVVATTLAAITDARIRSRRPPSIPLTDCVDWEF